MNKLVKEEFRKRVGRIVEKFRLEKGISRRELGEALGYVGNSAVQVVARFESGRAGIPKNKIDLLIKTLDIQNSDFGLDETKSLKNFIASGGFLGSAGAAFGKTWIDFMEATEAESIKNFLSSDDDDEEQNEDGEEGKNFTGTVRLLNIYRSDSPPKKHNLEEILNSLYDFSKGEENKLIDLMVTVGINPEEAYALIEEKLIDKLKARPSDSSS